MAIKYADNEKSKLTEINSLFKSWKNEVSTSRVKRNNGRYSSGKDLFSEDGFFPNYFNHRPKVLFMGREDTKCHNTIKEWIKIFENDSIPVSNNFFSTLLYLLYGINNGFPEYWENVPEASVIAQSIGKPGKNGLSFSFMELSKYGNNNGSDRCDKKLIEQFLEHSNLEKRKYFKEEFSILEPDIIITQNLWGISKTISNYIDECIFNDDLECYAIKYDEYANLFCITINKKKIPVIDMSHFSRKTNKDIETKFYKPLNKVIKSDGFKKNFPKIKILNF